MRKEDIKEGQILESKWNYEVVVRKNNEGFYGELICDENHPCKNIPYALNDGEGYEINLNNLVEKL